MLDFSISARELGRGLGYFLQNDHLMGCFLHRKLPHCYQLQSQFFNGILRVLQFVFRRSTLHSQHKAAHFHKGSRQLQQDITQYEDSFAAKADNSYADPQTDPDGPARDHVTDLLVSLYIQEIVLPQQLEDEKTFDPMDETQVDLTGLPNAKVTANG